MIGYWVSRGRPALHIKDTLLAATATPTPPNTPLYLPGALERAATEKKEQAEGKGKQKASDQEVKTPTLSSMATPARNTSTNPWTTIMASAADHADEHLTKVCYICVFWVILILSTDGQKFGVRRVHVGNNTGRRMEVCFTRIRSLGRSSLCSSAFLVCSYAFTYVLVCYSGCWNGCTYSGASYIRY